MSGRATLGDRYTRVRDLRAQLLAELQALGKAGYDSGMPDVQAACFALYAELHVVSFDGVEEALAR